MTDYKYWTKAAGQTIPDLAGSISRLLRQIKSQGLYQSEMWTNKLDRSIGELQAVSDHMARIVATKQREPIRADGSVITDQAEFIPDTELDEYERTYPYQYSNKSLLWMLNLGSDFVNQFVHDMLTNFADTPDEQRQVTSNLMSGLSTVSQVIDEVQRQILDGRLTFNYDQMPLGEGEMLRMVWHPDGQSTEPDE